MSIRRLSVLESTFLLSIASLLSLLPCGYAQNESARVPRVIRFSGTLKNVDGTPRPGTVGVTFSIYSEQDSAAALWQDVQNVTADDSGHYSVLLGAARSQGLPGELFVDSKARWLGMRIENEPELPRVLLAAVPYAIKAADAETLAGRPLSAFVLNDTPGGKTTGEGSASAGATAAADAKTGPHPMSINTSDSTGSQNQVAKWADNAGTLGNSVITDNGSGVGVNTTSPLFPLSVVETDGSKGGLLVGTDATGNMFTIDSAVGGGLANLVGGAYWNGSGHVYGGTRGASRIWLDDGQMHLFVGDASGTAGNGVAWNELVTLANSGNVGITNSNPQALLEVGIPGASSNQIRISGAGPNGIEFMNYDGSNAANLFFRTGLQNLQLETAAGAGTPLMSFAIGSGNVGIGTNSPSQKLDVAGNINMSGSLTATGSVTANSFAGSGAGLTSLPVTALVGAISDGQLSTHVALDNRTNAFTATQSITAAGTTLSASGGATGLHATGSSYGIYGASSGTGGYGVYGVGGGSMSGVYGLSTDGAGVTGVSTTSYGVSGTSQNSYGVLGSSNAGYGVYGTTASANYPGVYGFSSAFAGVYGTSTSGYGVKGNSSTGAGLFGISGSSYGVSGTSTNSHGVAGSTSSSTSAGVYGSSVNGYGVQGASSSNYGVYGTSSSGSGVYGSGYDGVFGVGHYGVHGSGNGGANALAGYFEGNVTVTGTLTKSGGNFKIDHPLDPANKYLSHSFVESPDMKNVYDGVVTIGADGQAWVTLPDWFEALNRDFRYQLTPIGAPGPNLYIAQEISGNRFLVAGGKPGAKVSWQVTGIRSDAWANDHRITVEENKDHDERGLYLYPQGYGQPASKAIGKIPNPTAQVGTASGAVRP